MCLWKELHWKFSKVKCLLLPAPEQLLSSSLGVFPSFPEGTQLIPKLPGASTQPFTQSHCRLLEQLTCPEAWPATGKAAVWAHRPCLATQELSPEGEVGATAHLATAGHWEVKLGRAWSLQTITFNTEQRRTGLGWGEVHSGVQVSSAMH